MKRHSIFLLFLLGYLSVWSSTNDSLRVLSLKNDIQEQKFQDSVEISSMLNELLGLYEQRYSTHSPQYADCLMWCASVCSDKGDNEQAKLLLKKSNKLFKQFGNGPFNGKDTINQIFYWDVKSKIEYNSGRDFMAVQLSQKSCRLKERYFGKEDEVYLNALLELSRLYAERLKYRKSNKYHNKGYNSYIQLIKDEFCSSSESERNTYWNIAAKYINRTINLAHSSNGKMPSIASSAYNALLLSKGLLLNTTITFENYIHESGNKRAIDNLMQKKKLTIQDAPQHVLDSLDYVILEALREQGQEYTIPQLSITWKDVRDQLGDEDLAIEFYRTSTNEYGAILLKKRWSSPKVVKLKNYVSLGDTTKFSLRDLIPDFLKRKSKRTAKQSYEVLEKQLASNPFQKYAKEEGLEGLWRLSSVIWPDDIVKYFPTKDSGRIYFSADGALLVTGIEHLPFVKPLVANGDIDSYYSIADLFDVYRLSSTRELITGKLMKTGEDAAIYGGLTYDMSTRDMVADMDNYPAVRKREIVFVEEEENTRAKRAAIVQIPYLKGTRIEADSITSIINSSAQSDISAKAYIANEGTEASFKDLSGKQKKIIHIATHGFYHNRTSGNNNDIKDNPLLRSGLFFSGADNAYNGARIPEGLEDGILTAHEISTLDLQGLDLVVLSACETAQGDISSDGVFGLQRGFKMASAGGILMSLWKVDDDATQVLMTEFYKHWMSGKSKHEALKIAKNTVRSHDKWKAPQYWAAFILLDGIEE